MHTSLAFKEIANIIKRHVDATRIEFEGHRFEHTQHQEDTLFCVARDFARLLSMDIVGHEERQTLLNSFMRNCGFPEGY